jgi:hypothetical protein
MNPRNRRREFPVFSPREWGVYGSKAADSVHPVRICATMVQRQEQRKERRSGHTPSRCALSAKPQRPTRSWRWLALVIGLLAAPALAEEASPPRPVPAAAAKPLAECLDTSESGRKRAIVDEFCLVSHERIGPLSIHLGQKQVMAALSCPVTKGKEVYWGATGDYNQEWTFPACGIILDMMSDAKGGPKVVRTIVAVAPSRLATSTGIHIGSTEEEVLTAYGPFLNREEAQLLDREETQRGKTIVAGSVYGGLIVDITKGRVSKMFLGAASEN